MKLSEASRTLEAVIFHNKSAEAQHFPDRGKKNDGLCLQVDTKENHMTRAESEDLGRD